MSLITQRSKRTPKDLCRVFRPSALKFIEYCKNFEKQTELENHKRSVQGNLEGKEDGGIVGKADKIKTIAALCSPVKHTL